MRALRLLLSRPYRRARRAEGAGDYRRAAALYAEADAPEEAANALLFLAARAEDLDERLAAYHDALRWLPPDDPRERDVEGRIGLAVLDEAQRAGVHGAEEERRLADAARRLERAGRNAEAATAWELLGRTDDVARCLEAAGEIERLEALLDRDERRTSRERTLRGLVHEYEMALAGGARTEAADALRRATQLAPEDLGLADLLRRLEARQLHDGRVELSVAGARVLLSGRLPSVLGRTEGDVLLRGASVSRRHAEVARSGGGFVVRDLDSHNGTLVGGIALAGELSLSGETEIGLGDDVQVRLSPEGTNAVRLTVVRGIDRGLCAILGEGPLAVPGLRARVSFEGGRPRLEADAGTALSLGGRPCAVAVELLRQDVLRVGDVEVEVVG